MNSFSEKKLPFKDKKFLKIIIMTKEYLNIDIHFNNF